jgi:hypothetical protein
MGRHIQLNGSGVEILWLVSVIIKNLVKKGGEWRGIHIVDHGW